MNIRQLTYFVEVCKHQSFTRAAEALFVTQSALSKMIKQLEGELGVQLVDRTSKPFKLTTEGSILYERGQLAIKHIDDEIASLYDSLNVYQGRICVGIPPVIGTAYFSESIHNYRNRYPQIELIIREVGANAVRDKIDSGDIDIGAVILPFESKCYTEYPIIVSENTLIVNENHPFATRESVTFLELKDENWILLDNTFMLHDRILQICESVGFSPHISCLSSQWDFIANMVAFGEGISILPKPIIKKFRDDRIRMVPLKEPDFPWDIALITRKDKYLSKPIKSFIEEARKV